MSGQKGPLGPAVVQRWADSVFSEKLGPDPTPEILSPPPFFKFTWPSKLWGKEEEGPEPLQREDTPIPFPLST